jgi:competence protein ComEA
MPAFTLSRRHAVGLAGLALAVVFAVALLRGGSKADPVAAGSTSEIPALTAPVASGPDGTASSSVVVVDVAGAVRRPGLYQLRKGSRIADAITRAGGVTRRAEETLVDLAAPLADGEQVLVPSAAADGSAVPPDGAPGTTPTAPVDLNSATAEQLDALPGIGPVTAQKIVDYRTEHGPYTSVDDLDAIPGIGPSRIDNLRGLVIP